MSEHTYLYPLSPSLGSLTPIYPIQALPAVKARLNTAIPQGAWLEGKATVVMDENWGIWLKLEEGMEVNIGEKLLERSVPAEKALEYPIKPRIFSQEIPAVCDKTTKGHTTTLSTQTHHSALLGPGSHPSVFYPVFEEMIQTLVDLQSRCSKKSG